MIVNLESLMAEVGPEHDDTDDSENSIKYKQLRELEQMSCFRHFPIFKTTSCQTLTY